MGIYVIALLYCVIVFIILKIIKQRYDLANHIFCYGIIVSLVLPLIGPFVFIKGYAKNAKTFDQDWLNLQKGLIDQNFINYTDLAYRAKQDELLIPINQGLELQDEQLVRHLLLELLDENIENEGYYIKKALASNNKEIIHYASTIFNTLLDKYKTKIEKLETLYQHDSSLENALKLSEYYIKFMVSNLLFEQEYLRLLKKANTFYERSLNQQDHPIDLVNNYINFLLHVDDLYAIAKAKNIALLSVEEEKANDLTYLYLVKLTLKTKDMLRLDQYLNYLLAQEQTTLSNNDIEFIKVLKEAM